MSAGMDCGIDEAIDLKQLTVIIKSIQKESVASSQEKSTGISPEKVALLSFKPSQVQAQLGCAKRMWTIAGKDQEADRAHQFECH